jgi:hypothetical protein
VSLVPGAFACPGAGTAVQGCPALAALEDVAEVNHLGACMLARAPLPPAFGAEAYQALRDWVGGRTTRAMTRSGYELQFDVSAAACMAFGFRAGDKVRWCTLQPHCSALQHTNR